MPEAQNGLQAAAQPLEAVGLRQNNLKNIRLSLPQNQLIVVTGVSGSGKSSLAFDTLFAEGQRRYIESLSSYIRQFVGKIEKPDMDYIKNLPPAIAIRQKVNSSNARSTVGTTTEIYDYLKLLFARLGRTISPYSGQEVKRHYEQDVADYVQELPEGTKCQLLAPLLKPAGRSWREELQAQLQKGFTRLVMDHRVVSIEEVLSFLDDEQPDAAAATLQAETATAKMLEEARLLVDRVSARPGDNENRNRLVDSAQVAFFEGQGACILEVYDQNAPEQAREVHFNNRFELDGHAFEEPSVNFFTFNNPYGACKRCEGFGTIIGYDEQKVVPDPRLSVYDGAVACWKGEKMRQWQQAFIQQAQARHFPIHKPYRELSEAQKDLLWNGDDEISGIYDFFRELESQAYKIQYRVLLSRYKGKASCPDCKGSRLRKDTRFVDVSGYKIHDLITVSIDKALERVRTMEFADHERKLAQRLLQEITTRLELMTQVGLSYLSLMRDSRTLSGGESQRIQLVTSLGSNLTGALYVLDEPSIGLHPRDNHRLLQVLRRLVALQNTVLVVEHEEDIIREADQIIDIGPGAGEEGGRLMFQGTVSQLVRSGKTLTADYLSGRRQISRPPEKPQAKHFIKLYGAIRHNLQDIDVQWPLHRMSVVTGVSGSGKSTLVREVLHPSLENKLQEPRAQGKYCRELEFDRDQLEGVEYVDQNPIGRSTRSNPLTYLKALDPVRELFARQRAARQAGLQAKHFSFNVEGGRCENCKGEGVLTVEMQFMADIQLTCEVCGGKRFKPEVLQVRYRDHSIYDILQLTGHQALDFFSDRPEIIQKLYPLQQVGLEYIRLGQASTDLSGGEAQRIKLASFLQKGNSIGQTLFIFDEPTTGLHFHDIGKLLDAFRALIDNGHTVTVIEHNHEVIKCADWVIDLGPEGGEGGGHLVFQGPVASLLEAQDSLTAAYLREKTDRDATLAASS